LRAGDERRRPRLDDFEQSFEIIAPILPQARKNYESGFDPSGEIDLAERETRVSCKIRGPESISSV
jgi:hypothetical protein